MITDDAEARIAFVPADLGDHVHLQITVEPQALPEDQDDVIEEDGSGRYGEHGSSPPGGQLLRAARSASPLTIGRGPTGRYGSRAFGGRTVAGRSGRRPGRLVVTGAAVRVAVFSPALACVKTKPAGAMIAARVVAR
jgi:hypothetical protein